MCIFHMRMAVFIMRLKLWMTKPCHALVFTPNILWNRGASISCETRGQCLGIVELVRSVCGSLDCSLFSPVPLSWWTYLNLVLKQLRNLGNSHLLLQRILLKQGLYQWSDGWPGWYFNGMWVILRPLDVCQNVILSVVILLMSVFTENQLASIWWIVDQEHYPQQSVLSMLIPLEMLLNVLNLVRSMQLSSSPTIKLSEVEKAYDVFNMRWKQCTQGYYRKWYQWMMPVTSSIVF